MAEFTGSRYVTCGVQDEIPSKLQSLMWQSIDDDVSLRKKVDYLQVFELKPSYRNGIQIQEIVHSQEQPVRRKRMAVQAEQLISAKVYVIDDMDHSTMLLSHEY